MANAGKVALVTGANKGIGREITRQLGGHGFTVLAGARDEHRGRAAAAELSKSGADPDGPDMGPDVIGCSASKAALNMVTVLYSRALQEEGIAVNAVSPGLVATDLTGHQGFRTAEHGAAIAVRTATSAGIPTGTFLNDNGPMTW
jgi:NAD(P)-dependent dehydrogenase (short-subunit alcohol dehydrogenase family)